jgi:hypothetical protein
MLEGFLHATPREFEAVEAKQKGDLAISGVDQPGSPIQE